MSPSYRLPAFRERHLHLYGCECAVILAITNLLRWQTHVTHLPRHGESTSSTDLQAMHITLVLDRNLCRMRHPAHLQRGLAAIEALRDFCAATVEQAPAQSKGPNRRSAPAKAAGSALSAGEQLQALQLPVLLRCVGHVLAVASAQPHASGLLLVLSSAPISCFTSHCDTSSAFTC